MHPPHVEIVKKIETVEYINPSLLYVPERNRNSTNTYQKFPQVTKYKGAYAVLKQKAYISRSSC
jgi:hypothetical protein